MIRPWATVFLIAVIVVGISRPTLADERDLDIKVVALKNPVTVGEKGELVIKTEVGAMCLGNAWPELQPSQRVQLSGKTVHGEGQTVWTWLIPRGGAVGLWKIDLQCATSEKKARLNFSFEVQ